MEPTIQVNELFGPTVQGEGPMIGHPCFFIRLHNCPVKCPGCDTAYSWDGSEAGRKVPIMTQANAASMALEDWLTKQASKYPMCGGVVLSGGEPLLHYKDEHFRALLEWWIDQGWDKAPKGQNTRWLGLETSGYIGPIPTLQNHKDHHGWANYTLRQFLECFTSISLSPKTTPCLHGKGTRDELLCNVQLIMDTCTSDGTDPELFIKMVVRDEADLAEVVHCNEQFKWQDKGHRVYLMPYGQERDEILRACELLVPACAKFGFILTPRLHSLIWGKERMR